MRFVLPSSLVDGIRRLKTTGRGHFERNGDVTPASAPGSIIMGAMESLLMLREDKALANRYLRSNASVESIREQIEGHTTLHEKVSTSVDLPPEQRMQARFRLCR